MSTQFGKTGDRYVACKHVISVVHGDETVLLDAEHNLFFSLNLTAGETWRALITPRTLEEAIAEFAERYDVGSDRLHNDLSQFIEALEARRLVERA
jgi:Coenzyme PQQ synthesis protein D (PqqD)